MNHRYWKRPLWPLLFALTVVLTSMRAAAQDQSSSVYWQYDAPGPLGLAASSDLDGDGISEFIITTEDHQAVLLDAAGRTRWIYEVPGEAPIVQIAAIDVEGAVGGESELLLATADELLMLAADGSLLWRQPIRPAQAGAGSPGASTQTRPLFLSAFDADGNGYQEIALVQQSGLLQAYDGVGELMWNYEVAYNAPDAQAPRLDVADIDGDGNQELAFSYFTRFSSLAIIDGDGTTVWEKALSGRIPALSFVAWQPGAPQDIAVANSFRGERVYVFDGGGAERWLRTPNRPVTSMTTANLDGRSALLIGTSVGTLAAYDQGGKRLWRYIPPTTSHSVVSISASPVILSQGGQAAVAFTLAASSSSGETADVILLDGGGEMVRTFAGVSASGQSQLVDSNGDNISELLIASFGTVSLADPGTGARKNSPAWDYRLALPESVLAADVDGDGADELLIGTGDGKLYLLEGVSGQVSSLLTLGGEVSFLDLTKSDPPLIVAAHNDQIETEDETLVVGRVELLQATGRFVWTDAVELNSAISSMLVVDLDLDGASEIVVGTAAGAVSAHLLDGTQVWRTETAGPVLHLTASEQAGQPALIAAVGGDSLYRFDSQGAAQPLAHYNLRDIYDVHPITPQPGEDHLVLVATGDGRLRTLSSTGAESWQWRLPEEGPALLQPAGDAFLVATGDGRLLHLDVAGERLLRSLDGLGDITELFWGDLDGGSSQDIAIGTGSGDVYLYTADMEPWDRLQLGGSDVFRLAGVHHAPGQQAQLAVVTDNGVVQLFEAKPNRPPLLINPRIEVGPGRYNVEITVIEESDDEVVVALEQYDTELDIWLPYEEERVSGRDDLLFTLSPETTEPLQFRFAFSDGAHEGVVTLPPGPAPQPVSDRAFVIAAPALVILAAFSAAILIRQSFSPQARVRRFYNRLRQQPEATLTLLESEYKRNAGSPDFLLNLANRARQDNNQLVANLTDSLFLLASRPTAAIPIITSALEQARQERAGWQGLALWSLYYDLALALLEAPTVTELSLLRPQLLQLVRERENAGRQSLALESLLRVLASLRDSERVDQVEDRIVYLHEGVVLLRHTAERLSERSVDIEGQLMGGIVERLMGLVNAQLEMLRGQAQLSIALKTKRIVPKDGKTVIALDVANTGRAAAEHVVITAEEDPAYTIHTSPQVIPVIFPGRDHQVHFIIEPHVGDRFRMAFRISYDDRIRYDRSLPFADMVHLLPPVREFTPIPNPYTPGTPLRGNSPLFYGREDLFNFIVENVGQISGRNVLILVGQRRTGKTSALLRLGQYLPAPIIPVYIDCQSLGVMPGMAALFNDLAWHIADSLAARDIEIDVPEPAVWRDDPGGLFQRQFVPEVQALLPGDAHLLLVFDEFEAFEGLVREGILPPTMFTYLRHLMQHSERMSFVFVGTHRLEEMTSDYWSVLFNIALYRQIGFLDKDASAKLVTEPVAPHIIYDDLALDKIWRVTAGQPYFLQLVCYTLVRRANSEGTGYVTISDVNAALAEMLRLGEVHFAYIWQRSSHTERALLTAVAHLMDRDVPFHPADLTQYLEQYGFRFEPAEVTAGLTDLVERDIMREVTHEGTTLYELKIGLVGLWAAQNKSLSKLYESRNGSESGRRVRPTAPSATTD